MSMKFHIDIGTDGHGDVILQFANLKPIAYMAEPNVHITVQTAREMADGLLRMAAKAETEVA